MTPVPGATISRVEYLPLSQRDNPDGRFTTNHDGIPPWLLPPLRSWFRPLVYRFVAGQNHYNGPFIEQLRLRMRMLMPLASEPYQAVDQLVHWMEFDDGLDYVDYGLIFLDESYQQRNADNYAETLNGLLTQGGSAWEVSKRPDDRYCLTYRELGPTRDAIETLPSDRAADHMKDAWFSLAGRSPNADYAYSEAVKAVEAAAKPVVSPKNAKTTLGTIIRDLRSAPQNFAFELGEVSHVIELMNDMWTTNLRHADEDAPKEHTQEEADAAVHLALTLVRWFAGGAVRRTDAA